VPDGCLLSNDSRQESPRAARSDNSHTRWLWLAVVSSALLSLPYLLTSQSFFSSDDWVHLLYNRVIPPWQVWRYFSPEAVWFYRPLQALQFGWLYHLVGLHPLPYNLCLWGMHLGVCALVFQLARQLMDQRVALLATVLFASSWVYVDVLFWRSNFNTLQWALATLGMGVLFLRYLRVRSGRLLSGVYLLCFINFLTKESAASAPLLLAALWWWHASEPGNGDPWRVRLREGVRLIAPFAALAALYICLHHSLVHDAYQGYNSLNYQFVSSMRSVWQTCFALNHLLLPFHADPLILPHLRPVASLIGALFQHVYILPCLLAAVLWRGRDRVVGLGLFWSLATLMPVTWLPDFHTSRYYYLPAVGASLMLARSIDWIWKRTGLSTRAVSGWRPAAVAFRLSVPVLATYLLLVNLSLVTLFCLRDRDETRLIKQAYTILAVQKGRVPRGSLIVMKNLPPACFVNGMGLPEMVRMALDDPAAHGVLEGERLPSEWVTRFQRAPSVFVLDFDRQPLALRCVRGEQANTARAADAAGHPGLIATRP
jgi:hypothetical protein